MLHPGPHLLPWGQLTDLWYRLHQLLIHALTQLSEERWNTVCRFGDGPEVPLHRVAQDYIERVKADLSEL